MQHGFDQPLYVQFGTFLIGLLHFDLGQSIQFSRPAIDVVLQAFPTTLMLAAVTLPIILAVAIVTGSLAAVRPGGLFDRCRQHHLADRRQHAQLLGGDRRRHPLRRDARLAADFGHRHAAALGAAGGGPGAPPARGAGAGGAQLDGRRAGLGLCQDRAGQGRRQGDHHLRPRAAQRAAARHHRGGRPARPASSTARSSSRPSSACRASAS